MEDIVPTLTECGLTSNEAKAYTSLLKIKKGTASDIAKAANIHRVNAYDVLKKLVGKGLIAESKKDSKKVYHIENPEYLKTIIEAKERKLDKILPTIKQQLNTDIEVHEVLEFSGPAGILNTYYMMLAEGKILYGIGGSGQLRKILKHRHQKFNEDRISKGMQAKLLYFEKTRGNRKKSWTNDDLVEIKFIPDKFFTETMTDVCGDLVIHYFPIEDDLKAVVIRDPKLAESQRQLFRYMWKFSKK